MTIVKELNNLSEKLTGVNPKATTDATAVKYINDNYGASQNYILDATFMTYFADPTKYGNEITIENEEHNAILNKIKEAVDKNNNMILRIGVINQNGYTNYYLPTVITENNKLTEVVLTMRIGSTIYEADVFTGSEFNSIIPDVYTINHS